MKKSQNSPGHPSFLEKDWKFLVQVQELIDREKMRPAKAVRKIVTENFSVTGRKTHTKTMEGKNLESTVKRIERRQREYQSRLRHHLAEFHKKQSVDAAVREFEKLSGASGSAAADRFYRASASGARAAEQFRQFQPELEDRLLFRGIWLSTFD